MQRNAVTRPSPASPSTTHSLLTAGTLTLTAATAPTQEGRALVLVTETIRPPARLAALAMGTTIQGAYRASLLPQVRPRIPATETSFL